MRLRCGSKLLAIASTAFAAVASPPIELATLAPSEGSPGDESGRAVAAAGPWILVGAPGTNTNGEIDRGAAWVYRRVGEQPWELVASLIDPSGEAGDDFGLSVAIDDPSLRGESGEPVAIVGALHDDLGAKTDAGSASIFRFVEGAWLFEQTIVASDGLADDEFGRSVAIRGDLAMVGAWDAGLFDQGAVYVYRRDPAGVWQQTQKLVAPGASTGDHLGTALDLDASGERAIAGAWGDDAGASNGGSALVWRRAKNGAFVFEQELVGSNLAPGDEVGRGVAIDGDLAVVGGWSFFGDGRGTARVFRRSGELWSEEAALEAPDGAVDDYFGFAVACRRGPEPDGAGDLIACGAWADDVAGVTNQGSVWLFERVGVGKGVLGWEPIAQLVAPDGTASDYFGFSLAFECELLAVGVRLDDVDGAINAGSARVWWIADDDGDGIPNDCGDSGARDPADLDGDGIVGAADLALLLGQWGGSGSGDLDGDGTVGAGDLATLLAAWSGA
jgi:hypothetical protein